MKNRPLSSENLMTENSKVHNTHSFTKSHVRDKDTLFSYQDISSRVSTGIDTRNQSGERLPQ